MLIYQLFASGRDLSGLRFTAYSRDVYANKDKAGQAVAAFIERCCDVSAICAADPESLKVEIIALELVEAL